MWQRRLLEQGRRKVWKSWEQVIWQIICLPWLTDQQKSGDAIRVVRMLIWHSKTTGRTEIYFSQFNQNFGPIVSHYPVILSFFGKNVLLTAKIKNTILHQKFDSSIHLHHLEIQLAIYVEVWQLMTKLWLRFLRQFSATFASISTWTTLLANGNHCTENHTT